MSMPQSAVLVLLSLAIRSAVSLDNGLARTPQMGWNPYNAFRCDTTEAQYHQGADLVVSLGLKDLGYKYVNLDCGWQGTARDANGGFTWDHNKLPSGPAALGTYVHNKGLNFGVYSDAGFFACDFVGGTAHYIGSLNSETKDAATFASWGADYLKYDNCYAVNRTDFVDFNPPIQVKPHFEAMRDALAATGRKILYSVCEWGVQDPARWPGTSVGNSWRTSNDINGAWADVFRILNQVVPITQFAGPGGWNDLDMLEVGNSGLTTAEQQTHFAFWAASKSPLIASTDLSKISQDALSILKNQRIIAVNQDPLGKPVSLKRRYADDFDVWSGPLQDGSTVAVIINFKTSSRSLTFNLADIGLASATGQDLISGANLGTLTGTYTTTVAAHGSLVLKLTSAKTTLAPSFTFYPAASSSNTLTGAASVRVVNSSVSVVGNIGFGDGSLIVNKVSASSAGSKLVSFDYINGDYTFTNTDCSNCRNAFVKVNGGAQQKVQMPISGQDWSTLYSGFVVPLTGFTAGSTNTIEILNPNAWAPDIYRVGVAQ